MPAEDTLKQRIHSGEIINGVNVSLDIDRRQLETIANQGRYDFLYVDGQHTAFSEDKLVIFCALAEEMELHVEFRIPHTRHAYLIGRYLDLGPTAIMVPEVAEEAVVDEAIAYFYYPQLGRRSWGGTSRRGIKARGDRLDRLEYVQWWNSFGFLAIQLESIEAIINAGHLAKPGIDLLAFGPNDLRFSLEAHPLQPFKTVDDCIRHAAEQVADSSIRLAMGVDSPAEKETYLEMGVTVFTERLGT